MVAAKKVRAPARKQRAPDMGEIITRLAGDSRRARRMSDVEAFRAVPTIFTSFNRAIQVGGAPLSCVWLVHGPSTGGKTAFLLGVARAVQAIGGIFVFVDAEHSADTKRWFRLCGINPDEGLYIGRTGDEDTEKKPLTYEEVVDEVQNVISRYQEGKREGWVRPGTPLFIVVDSVSKMAPKSAMKKIAEDGGDGLHGGIGRLQALLNAAWLITLGPIVGNDDIVLALIAHEYESAKAGGWKKSMKVRGGDALVFDSMVQLRVNFASQVKDAAKDSAPMVGKKHSVLVLKNKHGPAYDWATFFLSNGRGTCPMGFDHVREVLHEAIKREVIEGPTDKRGFVTLTLGSRVKIDGKMWTVGDFYEPESNVLSVFSELERELDSGSLDAKVVALGEDDDDD